MSRLLAATGGSTPAVNSLGLVGWLYCLKETSWWANLLIVRRKFACENSTDRMIGRGWRIGLALGLIRGGEAESPNGEWYAGSEKKKMTGRELGP